MHYDFSEPSIIYLTAGLGRASRNNARAKVMARRDGMGIFMYRFSSHSRARARASSLRFRTSFGTFVND